MPTDREFLNAIGQKIADRIKDRIRENRVVATDPNTPKKKSGATLMQSSKLMQSIHHLVVGDTVYIGTNLAYGKIHHTGGNIFAKPGKALAVPIHELSKNKSPKDFPNLKKLYRPDPDNKDKLICYLGIKGKTTRGDKLLFVLRKKITIPARPYMLLDNTDRDMMLKSINDYLQRVVHKK